MNPLIRPEGPVFQAFIPHNVHKPVVGVPGAPTGLSAKLFRAEEVDLSWNNVSNRATGIKVQRKKAPHTFYTTIATLDPDQTSYTDEVDVDEKYSYRVVAFNEYGDSAPTNSVDISTVFPAPKAPSDLTAEIRDKKWVKLNWRDNSNDEIYFLIERKSEGSNFTEIAYLSSNVTTYNDYGVENGKTYTYRMSCYNGLKSSAHSQAVSVTIPTVFLPGGSAPGGCR